MFIIAIGILLICGASLKTIGIVTLIWGVLKTIVETIKLFND